MQVILHIFCKDARRLWKEIAVTWVLLVLLTRADCWRTGYMPEFVEGWLNLLLPLAWCYLAGLCVLQDAVPGESQFWLTLPYRRTSLIAAKFLFITAFVNAPYLISNIAVVHARGFQPLEFIPQLLQKQLFLLLVLILPSFALAAIARNAVQFVLLVIAVAGAAIFVIDNGHFMSISLQPMPWLRPSPTLDRIALPLLAVLSVTILWIQYQGRRTGLSRSVGLIGLAAASAICLWLPPRLSASLEMLIAPLSDNRRQIAVRLMPQKEGPSISGFAGSMIFIPLDITGIAHGENVSVENLYFQIDGSNGVHLKGDAHPASRGNEPSVFAYLTCTESTLANCGLMLNMSRWNYERLANISVTLKGQFIAEVRHATPRHELSEDKRTEIPAFGTCSAAMATTGWSLENILRVACESPSDFPPTQVFLTDTKTGRQWNELLGGGVTMVSYPRNTWLSPVDRREAFFHVTSGDVDQPESRWRVPQDVLTHYRIEIEPQPLIARTMVAYELPGIVLNKYKKIEDLPLRLKRGLPR